MNWAVFFMNCPFQWMKLHLFADLKKFSIDFSQQNLFFNEDLRHVSSPL